MKTVAFEMKLTPGNVSEYRRRHDEIWPELSESIREAGISDYSIFPDEETLTLFAVRKQADPGKAAGRTDHAIVRKWWDFMAPPMEVNPDKSPVAEPLPRIFHLP